MKDAKKMSDQQAKLNVPRVVAARSNRGDIFLYALLPKTLRTRQQINFFCVHVCVQTSLTDITHRHNQSTCRFLLHHKRYIISVARVSHSYTTGNERPPGGTPSLHQCTSPRRSKDTDLIYSAGEICTHAPPRKDMRPSTAFPTIFPERPRVRSRGTYTAGTSTPSALSVHPSFSRSASVQLFIHHRQHRKCAQPTARNAK